MQIRLLFPQSASQSRCHSLNLNSMNGLQTTLCHRRRRRKPFTNNLEFVDFFWRCRCCFASFAFLSSQSKQTNLINKNDKNKPSIKTNNRIMVLDITCIISARARLHAGVADISTIHHVKCIIHRFIPSPMALTLEITPNSGHFFSCSICVLQLLS